MIINFLLEQKVTKIQDCKSFTSKLRFLKFQRNTSRSEINIYAFIFHITFAIFRIACCKANAILKSLFCGVNYLMSVPENATSWAVGIVMQQMDVKLQNHKKSYAKHTI